jgi:hypothetical protein
MKKPVAQVRPRATSFADSPALIRTPEGMATFAHFNSCMETWPSREWSKGLREHVPEIFGDEEPEVIIKAEDEDAMDIDGESQLGDKRKL